MNDKNASAFSYRRTIELLWLAVIFLVPVFFNPWEHGALYVHKALLLQFLAIAMLAFAIADWISSPDRPHIGWRALVASPVHICIMAFGLLTVVATVMSITPGISFWGSYFRKEGLLTLLCWIMFFLILTTYMRSRQQVFRAIYALLLSSSIVSAVGVAQRFFPAVNETFHWVYSARVFSTTGNSLSLSLFLAMVLPITLALIVWIWSYRHRRNSIWKLAALAVLLILQSWCLWLAQYSVTILLYIIAPFIFILLLGIIKRSRLVLAFSGVSLLILAVVAASLLIPLFSHKTGWDIPGGLSLSSDVSADSLGLKTLPWRVQYWRSSLDIVLKTPAIPFYDDKLHALRAVIGYGPETFQITFQQVFPKNLIDHSLMFIPLTRPHNHYLYLATTVGLLGLASFLAILSAFFYLCARYLRRATKDMSLLLIALMASLAGYMVDYLFNPSTVSTELVFWLILSLVIVVGRLSVVDKSGTYALEEAAGEESSEASDARRAKSYISVVCAALLIAGGGFITLKPLLADMYLQKGLNFYYSPYGTETYFALSKAAELAPAKAVYQSYLGEYGYYLARQVTDESTKVTFLKFSASAYEKARQLEPYVAYRYHLPADVYTYWAKTGAEDKWASALTLYDKAWQLSPQDTLILDKWALALLIKGNVDEARTKLELAKSIDPGWFGTDLISALVMLKENKDADAISSLVASTKENSYDFANHFDKLCFMLADYDMVKPLDKALGTYVQQMPGEWTARAMLGVTSLFLGNLEKSVSEFKAANALAAGEDTQHFSTLLSKVSGLSPSLKAQLPSISK